MSPGPNHFENSNFYGRRLGRPLSESRQKALDALLPKFEIPAEDLKEDGTLNPNTLFQSPSKTIFEIGFGDGKRLAEHMQNDPEMNVIGAEPFINGMSSFLRTIDDTENPNIRLFMEDAMIVARSLTNACLDEIYILNPDPWHKTRHHKRRIVNPRNLHHFARILKPGGKLYLTTDVPYLAEWMVTHTSNHPAFNWLANSAADWQTPPKNWIHTTYETKRAKGADRMVYMIFEKKPCKNT